MSLSPQQLTDIAFNIAKRFDKVNSFYLKLMATQIKEIGKLDPDNIHRLRQMTIMGNNITAINEMLMKETGLALKEIQKLYMDSAIDEYKDVAYLYNYRKIKQPPFSKNTSLLNYIESVNQLTNGTFLNMANTTVISKDYRDAVDLAIDAITTGIDSWSSAMRKMLLNKSRHGMRVTYASGRTRRLDSAAKMNILEGVRQVNAGIRKEMGKQYKADGVEIDAHGLCAEDHLPYQGKQYTIKAYEKLNEKLQRPIGTLNCRHEISYVILGVSPKTYTDKELELMKEKSTSKVKFNGKEYTKYEASQLMRKLETEMRYTKDDILTLRYAGLNHDKEMKRLENLNGTYKKLTKQAKLTPHYNRTYVSGFDEDDS